MRERTSVSWLGFALFVAHFACSCGSTRATADLPRDPVSAEAALGERLSLRDPRNVQDGEAAYLEVTVANSSGARVTARCAPEWYDAKGAVVAAPIAWQDLDLRPGEERRLRFAPMPGAARSWRLRFVP